MKGFKEYCNEGKNDIVIYYDKTPLFAYVNNDVIDHTESS